MRGALTTESEHAMKFAQVILCSQMALKPLRIENGPEHHLRAESFSTRPFGDSLELKFELDGGFIPVQMFGVHVLVNADKAALKNRKEAFKSVRVGVAALPFKLGMVNGFMRGDWRKLVVLRLIGHKATFMMYVLANDAHNAAMVQHR